MSDLVQDTTFSGEDWALEEVDADLTRADLSYARLKETRLDGADLRGAELDGVALREVDRRGARIDLAQAAFFASAHGAVVSG